jgi:uncharacterized membrane protein HdeD (DUF308 family)
MSIIVILLFATMLAVVAVMTAGVVLMARGGEVNKKYSNRLMQWRVMLQGIALVLVGILFASGD